MSKQLSIPANTLALLLQRAEKKITIDSNLQIVEDENNYSLFCQADANAILVSRVPKRTFLVAPNQTKEHQYG